MSDKDAYDWSNFFQSTTESLPHETVLKAIDLFAQEPTSEPRFAIDLGCGMGRDTFELLRNGWRVLAMDKEQEPLDWINEQKPPGDDFLETRRMGFEKLDLNGLNPNLVNASFTLPFCPKDNFENVWETIRQTLKPGSRFSGHFFGINDTWASEPLDIPTLHFNLEQVQALFTTFDINYFEEKDELGGTATGPSKHWHIFSVVASKQ